MNEYKTVHSFVETHAEWEKEFFCALITGTNDVLYKSENEVVDDATTNWEVWGQVMHDAVVESKIFPEDPTIDFRKPEDVEKFLLKKNREYCLEAFSNAEPQSMTAEDIYRQLMRPWAVYIDDLNTSIDNIDKAEIHHATELKYLNFSEFLATMLERLNPGIMRRMRYI
ncbi:hypothetical protein HYALB_00010861 [Hymenoscyphus albidus]|uniref:Uncharacterized protein n=1 Tax=Hymenoscyphus albidus TaxID=595503 RepID=A0A9N9Q015_9HELO|nr:hypothetical protein HYALB_00010861 [Hymenoscyphus albidus]